LLELGITRVILGTKAVHDFDWFSAVVKEHPGRIVLSLDARGTKVATDGWKTETAVELMDVAQRAAALPLEAIIFTDINKDGMLSGPNIERTRHLAETVKLPIIAAGGVTTIEDIQKLAETKVIAAAIIGRCAL
jgi:phosphoribosylformimino-5-aminoimidazole carboxamide ribotide isomerase